MFDWRLWTSTDGEGLELSDEHGTDYWIGNEAPPLEQVTAYEFVYTQLDGRF